MVPLIFFVVAVIVVVIIVIVVVVHQHTGKEIKLAQAVF